MPELKEILAGIRAKHGNQSEVAEKLGISSQLLGQYERGERNPKLGFYKKWEQVFGQDLLALKDEANVSREAKNGTSAIETTNNKKNGMAPKETFYQYLIEESEEYSLIPRAVFRDYKIVPDKIIDVIIASHENEKKALIDQKGQEIESLNDKHDLVVKGLENKIERLEKENKDLLLQIPTKGK